MLFAPVSALYLWPAMLLLVRLGHELRIRRANLPSSGIVESAVFALLGLLLAFTFSGAVSRYDHHRELLTQEVNSVGTAYLRLDLLPPSAQPAFRRFFQQYVTSRLHLFDKVGAEISADCIRLQNEIWREAVAHVNGNGSNPDAAKLLLPAINDMIDITTARQNGFNMHPPDVVFALLFVLSCVCAFITGYGAKEDRRDIVYSIALATAMTLTIYVTLDIEFPRQGLIRLSPLDQKLIELRDSMK